MQELSDILAWMSGISTLWGGWHSEQEGITEGFSSHNSPLMTFLWDSSILVWHFIQVSAIRPDDTEELLLV
jgi:hypothetical protein